MDYGKILRRIEIEKTKRAERIELENKNKDFAKSMGYDDAEQPMKIQR